MQNEFEIIRERLSIKEVAEQYGLKITNNKMACFLHNDRNPSISIKNNNWRCWACDSGGSVIDLTMKLFNLNLVEAAKKLSEDFNLGLFEEKWTPQRQKEIEAEIKKQTKCNLTIKGFTLWTQETEDWLLMIFKIFNDVIRDLPPEPNKEPLKIWNLAANEINQIENVLDVLQLGSHSEKTKYYKTIKNYQENLNQRILKIISSVDIYDL